MGFATSVILTTPNAFWNDVDKVMPAYGEGKEWLRVHGAGLDV
jgi:predicted metal-dependent hydrolase